MAAAREEAVSYLEDVVERQARFVGSYAHEARTALTSIIGYAELLCLDALDGEERAEACSFILTEGRRLERLSQSILDLIAMEERPLRLTAADPVHLVDELVAKMVPLYAKRGVSLAFRGEGEGSRLLEPDLVASLVENLCENARKALGGEGSIEVRCSMLPDGCCISVADTGPGVPPEALERLTEAFYRVEGTRSEEGGAGLGLTLCRRIALAHGGSLAFKSEPGKGAVVTAELRAGAA